jgi:hypothetical protein
MNFTLLYHSTLLLDPERRDTAPEGVPGGVRAEGVSGVQEREPCTDGG